MTGSVDVIIPVDAAVAAGMTRRDREDIGRLVSDMLRSSAEPSPLAMAIGALKSSAQAAGLTDDDVDAELPAHKAERRANRSID